MINYELREKPIGERFTSMANHKVRKAKRGFTLVELLVVIAIIGILMAMVLPAVQASRESARKTQCLNNLKNLATGSLLHLQSQKYYPGGGWGWRWAGDPDQGFGMKQPGSWLYSILPYIEETNLHDLGRGDTVANKRKFATQTSRTPIPIFNCPTRRRADTLSQITTSGYNNMDNPGEIARTDYAACSGTGSFNFSNASTTLLGMKISDLHANFSTSSDAAIKSSYNDTGVICFASQFSDSAVKDGQSKTYLCGEKAVPFANYETISNGDNEGWVHGYDDDNQRGTLVPPTSDTDAPSNYNQMFGAAHTAVFNMAFCDGSIKSITLEIDAGLHYVLGHRADGQTKDGKIYDASGL
jgi:prepilin-type N-terminal cleavage/methylation domain-containing protein